MKGYPRGFLSILLLVIGSLCVTGVLMIPTTLDSRFEMDVIWRLSGPYQHVFAIFHTVSSYLILMAVGALFAVHIRSGLRQRKSLISGLSLLLFFLLLLGTGCALFYMGDPDWILPVSAIHSLVGGLLLVVFIVHWVVAQRSAKQKKRQHLLY
jgi:heme A synthase